MRNSPLFIAALVISTSAFAEPQLIVCKSIQTFNNQACKTGDIARLQHFLVDTDDFEKEDPEYEYQLVYSCVEKNPDFEAVGVLGASTKSIMGYQQKFRYPYVVTANTLSFQYDLYPSDDMSSHWIEFELDRETLTAGDTTYCTIEQVED